MQAERVRPQSISQTLTELENDGLISRRPDARDGRLSDEEPRTLRRSVDLLDRLSGM